MLAWHRPPSLSHSLYEREITCWGIPLMGSTPSGKISLPRRVPVALTVGDEGSPPLATQDGG